MLPFLEGDTPHRFFDLRSLVLDPLHSFQSLFIRSFISVRLCRLFLFPAQLISQGGPITKFRIIYIFNGIITKIQCILHLF